MPIFYKPKFVFYCDNEEVISNMILQITDLQKEVAKQNIMELRINDLHKQLEKQDDLASRLAVMESDVQFLQKPIQNYNIINAEKNKLKKILETELKQDRCREDFQMRAEELNQAVEKTRKEAINQRQLIEKLELETNAEIKNTYSVSTEIDIADLDDCINLTLEPVNAALTYILGDKQPTLDNPGITDEKATSTPEIVENPQTPNLSPQNPPSISPELCETQNDTVETSSASFKKPQLSNVAPSKEQHVTVPASSPKKRRHNDLLQSYHSDTLNANNDAVEDDTVSKHSTTKRSKLIAPDGRHWTMEEIMPHVQEMFKIAKNDFRTYEQYL